MKKFLHSSSSVRYPAKNKIPLVTLLFLNGSLSQVDERVLSDEDKDLAKGWSRHAEHVLASAYFDSTDENPSEDHEDNGRSLHITPFHESFFEKLSR